MSAIDQLFTRLRAKNQRALMPFLTAGDPDLPTTALLLRELVRRGAVMCELGIPYSDPIADGPVIQASYTRALAKKIKLADILECVRSVAPELGAPVVSMVSYAIVYRHGPREFVAAARAAGLAGAIIPDLPLEEGAALAAICREADFSLIQLVTPTTPRDRAVRIAENSSGFLYYVSVTGITGERRDLPPELAENVGWLRQRTPLPICIGFGISTPEHVRLLAPVADGLIVGSALVRRIADHSAKPGHPATSTPALLADVGDYVATLLAALNPP
ncbi:MAG: tryptophan synthase subunit alpha [Pirellulales bacterium]|nr:tryptophan synthase subunit alpha [Pirellulales bacterium]